MHKYASPEQFLAEVSNVVSQLFVDPSRMNDLRQILTKDGVGRGAEVEVYCRDRTKKWVLLSLRAACDAAATLRSMKARLKISRTVKSPRNGSNT